jgi:hypothetical protein
MQNHKHYQSLQVMNTKIVITKRIVEKDFTGNFYLNGIFYKNPQWSTSKKTAKGFETFAAANKFISTNGLLSCSVCEVEVPETTKQV